MAVLDYVGNMNDVRLKPRLLKSMMKDRLPDEKHPFPSPSELSAAVSSVKTHGLLSEVYREQDDRKQVESWKAAVDAWVERVLSLASSKMPDKCWAGICLLGITAQECSADRFLTAYSVWFQKLLSHIQPPSDSHFVKVACCASLSDLFTRLGCFPNVKKDGTSHAGKVIQPILKLLNEDESEAVWESTVNLLCTLLTYFPASVTRHYDSVEAVIVSKILSGKCSSSICKRFSSCLSLLPTAKGDEDSWSLLMQRILISINTCLSDAFQGLEEETKGAEFLRLLVPPGKDPPPPLGGHALAHDQGSGQSKKKFQNFSISSMSTLMECGCLMLTNTYPVQVSVPIRPLLALVERVLTVDGSLFQSLMPFTTVKQQEHICSQLPVLHSCGLNLLISVIKGLRSQLLPHAAGVVRLLTNYFKRCVLPSLRIKVYSIISTLLISMGAGMAIYLAQDVIVNAFADLQFVKHESRTGFSDMDLSKFPGEALPSYKKRKHVSDSPGELQSGAGVGAEILKHKQPISVQIAALQAIEALLTVGGAMKSECWRSDVDRLLINVATSAYEGGWTYAERILALSEEQTSRREDFQLAAFRALLVSLLSPARFRPPYLSQGLELFRRGKQEVGTKLAELCSHALLALEVLIHPRALPLSDFSVCPQSTLDGGFSHGLSENIFSGSRKPNTTFSRGAPGVDEFEPDADLCDSWLGNDEQAEPQTSTFPSDIPMSNIYTSSEYLVEPAATQVPEIVKLHEVQFAAPKLQEVVSTAPVSDEGMADLDRTEVRPSSTELKVLSNEELSQRDVIPSEELISGDDDVVFATRKDVTVSATPSLFSDKGKGLVDSDSDTSALESLPDIIDADPDTSDADSD
ncbi:hypothetical protein H6P81_011228 [Aristolochia fimbriata]|uniref:Pre-rRNA-processing protein RIX1 N-terminal domain-containing protein n=1 Tax=Aristolochia fimbriata TaxID=158543 RepID=A0AAV7EVE1_ARIFI|nr:hypothetical protein H6P81_011228 [Aristolochia fimbriata]